ncbi:hypothetical protein [uncultured Slackia sp.]|uniref:hypothetical protein n=1 Tax=uncultured Slackia sp. TaxID=665903 RepID=UPI0025D873A8|nr:hypothetical protein [uncultured Slackia sp.]
MTTGKKVLLAVAAGMAALGIVLMGVGFVMSGFDSAVFTMHVDTREGIFVLGGHVVENPSELPFLGTIANLGTIGYESIR